MYAADRNRSSTPDGILQAKPRIKSLNRCKGCTIFVKETHIILLIHFRPNITSICTVIISIFDRALRAGNMVDESKLAKDYSVDRNMGIAEQISVVLIIGETGKILEQHIYHFLGISVGVGIYAVLLKRIQELVTQLFVE